MFEAFSLVIIIFKRKETMLDLKALYFLQIVTGKLSNEKRSTTGNRIDQNTTHSYLNFGDLLGQAKYLQSRNHKNHHYKSKIFENYQNIRNFKRSYHQKGGKLQKL